MIQPEWFPHIRARRSDASGVRLVLGELAVGLATILVLVAAVLA